jgi:protein-L-isoaspartate(D-aspartate) O-methyltransferase
MEDGEHNPSSDPVERIGQNGDNALANFLISLRSSGIRRPAIISAFEETQRRFFLPPELRSYAYAPFALPIGCGEEATAPAEIARLLSVADPVGADRVLEIGTGSGFQTALLSRICRSIVSVERWQSLSEAAAHQIQRDALRNVELRHADGMDLPIDEQFDLIVVNAVLPRFPPALTRLLKPQGRLVAGLQRQDKAELVRAEQGDDDLIIAGQGAISLPPIRQGISAVF